MDERAIGTLYAEHRGLIFNYLRRIVGDSDLAEDLCQETFEQVLKYSHTYKPERGNFAVWACTIARNLAFKVKRREPEMAEYDTNLIALPISGQTHSILEKEFLGQALNDAISGLPEPERTIVRMKYIDKATIKQIAVAVRTSERTIRRKTLKAVGMVRERLKEQELMP